MRIVGDLNTAAGGHAGPVEHHTRAISVGRHTDFENMDRAIAMGRVPAVLKRTFLFVAEIEAHSPRAQQSWQCRDRNRVIVRPQELGTDDPGDGLVVMISSIATWGPSIIGRHVPQEYSLWDDAGHGARLQVSTLTESKNLHGRNCPLTASCI